MAITDNLVLPEDLMLIPVSELSEEVRRQCEAGESDIALTRPHSRIPSKIVDAETAALLKEFRNPSTVAAAVIRFSRARSTDPEQTLEDAFPIIERFISSRLLVEPDSNHSQKIQALFSPTDRFAGSEVVSCVQVLEDTDLYRVKTGGGEFAALKVLRSGSRSDMGEMFDREAFILEKLNGSVSPKLLASGVERDHRYLLMEWCAGEDCGTAAGALRNLGARDALLELCGSILDAYSELHARNVIHSDIHPRNVLVDARRHVRLVDFGFARVRGEETPFRTARRGGIGFFFEPEYAGAARNQKKPPSSSLKGEQYALAALLYSLLTGKHYVDFSLEKKEMLRQISEDPPLPFAERGMEPWPEVETLLVRALEKDPRDRFATIGAWAEEWKRIPRPNAPRSAEPVATIAEHSYDEARKLLEELLSRLSADGVLFKDGLKTSPKISVTYGSAGIAHALCRIACAKDDPALLSLADLWSMRAVRHCGDDLAYYSNEIEITPDVVGRISPYHTESGVRAVEGAIGVAMGDVVAQQNAINNFIGAVKKYECSNLDVTLGRSGVLLIAALLAESMRGSAFVDLSGLVELGREWAENIWKELCDIPPVREGRKIHYSGAAHGWAGVLYSLLRWHRTERTQLPADFEERLVQLSGLAQHTARGARWNWIIGQHGGNDGGFMSGWCNGSAGFVFLWLAAYEMFKDNRYMRLAEKAAWDAWETDAELGNLCCGFAGQAYAALALYRASGESEWLYRAQALTQKGAQSFLTMNARQGFEALTERPESLYKGELGLALLAAELENPRFSAMPFYEVC